jgi:hypothetical protein
MSMAHERLSNRVMIPPTRHAVMKTPDVTS